MTLEITTNLKDNSQNVTVNSFDELQKFVKFAGGEMNVYVWLNEWVTVFEFNLTNNIAELF